MHRLESSIYCMLIIYVETFAYWPVIIWQLQILFKHQTKTNISPICWWHCHKAKGTLLKCCPNSQFCLFRSLNENEFILIHFKKIAQSSHLHSSPESEDYMTTWCEGFITSVMVINAPSCSISCQICSAMIPGSNILNFLMSLVQLDCVWCIY